MKMAFLRVLEMSPAERSDRMRRNLEFSERLTTVKWATQVLYDLKCVEKSTDHSAYSGVGFGMGFRVMGVKAGFNTLDVVALNKSYRASQQRLILLDWGGTLVAENDTRDNLQAYALAQGIATRTGPNALLKDTLEALCSDPKNTVFVVSGKDMFAVGSFFGDVNGLGLGAEHGFYYRWPVAGSPPVAPNSPSASSNTPGKLKWHAMQHLNHSEKAWRDPALKVMELYMERTHGTYIEQKGHALIWQFRDADPEFGYMQSKELEEHLTDLMLGYSVDVIRGGGVSDGYIEIRPAGVSKGLFLKHALEILENRGVIVDFLMAVGDDSSDEPMFEQIESLTSQTGGALTCYGVTVGKKATRAQSYVDDPAAVLELLTTLTKSSTMRGFGSNVELSGSADKLTRGSSERLARDSSKLSGNNSSSGMLRSMSVGVRMNADGTTSFGGEKVPDILYLSRFFYCFTFAEKWAADGYI